MAKKKRSRFVRRLMSWAQAFRTSLAIIVSLMVFFLMFASVSEVFFKRGVQTGYTECQKQFYYRQGTILPNGADEGHPPWEISGYL
jgi:hypothetical protein